MHPSKKIQIAHLKVNEALTEVFSEYANFADIFSSKLTLELLKYTSINDNAIELVDNWQPSYCSINSLGLIELKILKTYIKNNLANSFIRSFKFLGKPPIFFNKKPDRSLTLYINYQAFNNLTIKNRYSLPLIGKLLDWLDQAWRFTQLDLTNAYHQMKIRKGNK